MLQWFRRFGWFNRWEVYCTLTQAEQVVGGKCVGTFPTKRMAANHARFLEGSPQILATTMKALAVTGSAIFADYTIRRIGKT